MWNDKVLFPGRLTRRECPGRIPVWPTLLFTSLLAFMLSTEVEAEDTNPPVAGTLATELTNLQEHLKAIVDFEGQLKANQMALEQNGKEAREAAARNSELLSNGLQSIQAAVSQQQRALSEQNERELVTVQSSTRTLLIVGGIFAGVASLALLLVTYFQYRMSKVWAEITGGLPALAAPGSSGAMKQLGRRSLSGETGGSAEAAEARLVQALEKLESRVNHLERGPEATPHAWSVQFSSGENDGQPAGRLQSLVGGGDSGNTGARERVSALLEQGQLKTKQNDWEGALRCFEQALEIAPNHGEALVKKGAALEHLRKLNEAFECYDQAIASNDSVAIAYLHKGGLCSRLERFKEALDCYEKALQTHDS